MKSKDGTKRLNIILIAIFVISILDFITTLIKG